LFFLILIQKKEKKGQNFLESWKQGKYDKFSNSIKLLLQSVLFLSYT
jgi:hypothetical protein